MIPPNNALADHAISKEASMSNLIFTDSVSLVVALRRFALHFIEMCVVMCAGGLALDATVFAVWGALGHPDLVADAPAGFRVIGPLSWSGASATGVRAVRRTRDLAPAGDKPAVFVLPGILGSNLKAGGKRIWLSWRLIDGLKRLQYTSGRADDVAPDGAIELTYGDLEAFLATTHEVVEFAYDWRRPLEEEARRLAEAVEAALAARKRSGQPVRFVAHSMGGLLARTMQLERPAVWQRTMAHPGARVLMLGTPNGGSWAPMQVLSGDDTFGNALVAIGAPFQDHDARQLMAGFPGFIQLQAALTDPSRLRSLRPRVKSYGIQFVVTQQREVRVPAYNGTLTVKYSASVGSGELPDKGAATAPSSAQ
jgi:hypothetical protein